MSTVPSLQRLRSNWPRSAACWYYCSVIEFVQIFWIFSKIQDRSIYVNFCSCLNIIWTLSFDIAMHIMYYYHYHCWVAFGNRSSVNCCSSDFCRYCGFPKYCFGLLYLYCETSLFVQFTVLGCDVTPTIKAFVWNFGNGREAFDDLRGGWVRLSGGAVRPRGSERAHPFRLIGWDWDQESAA